MLVLYLALSDDVEKAVASLMREPFWALLISWNVQPPCIDGVARIELSMGLGFRGSLIREEFCASPGSYLT